MNMKNACGLILLWLAALGLAHAQSNPGNAIEAVNVSEQGGKVVVRVTTR